LLCKRDAKLPQPKDRIMALSKAFRVVIMEADTPVDKSDGSSKGG
jgi:hypothetical protein